MRVFRELFIKSFLNGVWGNAPNNALDTSKPEGLHHKNIGAKLRKEGLFDEKVKKYTQALMHEFSHYLTLSDHYCQKTEKDENGENITECGGKACYTCVFGYENEEDMPKCVMLASDYAYNDLSEIYCNYCIEIIKDHLGFVE